MARLQGAFDMNAARVISPADTALIESRRQLLRVIHIQQLGSPRTSLVFDAGSVATIEGKLWARELGFAKLAIINRGAALLDHWPAIYGERQIPPRVLAWEVDEAGFARTDFSNTFYLTVRARDQDATQLRLHGGRWIFADPADVPGFSVVSDQEAKFFYGHVGGVEHADLHPQMRTPWNLATQAGRTINVDLSVTGGVPPFTWRVESHAIGWLTVTEAGVATFAPPITLRPGTYNLVVAARDSAGTVAHSEVNLDIRPPTPGG